MIGIDIVENSRMQDKSEEFIKRILSKSEVEVYNNKQNKVQYLASRFAAKEAIFKVFKCGDKTLNYNDISILNDENGAPYILMNSTKRDDLKISISHERNYSVAIVMKTK